jgi:hypothetical protein
MDALIADKPLSLLLQLLQTTYIPLLAEVSWIITNICGSNTEHTDAVIDAGGIDLIMPLLSSSHSSLLEQVWPLVHNTTTTTTHTYTHTLLTDSNTCLLCLV